MLRSLDPAAARQFETLPAVPQESFRKSFAEFLSTYPTAPDSRRLAFVRQALDEATGSLADESPAAVDAAPPPSVPPVTPAASDEPAPGAPADGPLPDQ